MTTPNLTTTAIPDPVIGGLYRDSVFPNYFLIVLGRCNDQPTMFVCLETNNRRQAPSVRNHDLLFIHLNHNLVTDFG
jgi:hypothetical protein